MDLYGFSLIYPDAQQQRKLHGDKASRPDISLDTVEQLGMSELLTLNNSSLSEYFTSDPEVIGYRQRTFADLLEYPEIIKTLNSVIPTLMDIMELRRLEADTGETASYLLSITEIELYISCVEIIYEGFSPLEGKLASEAFRTLTARISELWRSDYYRDLNEKLRQLTSRVREIKSITVGVNLDAQLRPDVAGVLSINNESFKSGDVIEKILHLDFRSDEYTCIAPLVPFSRGQNENRKTALSLAFNSAINDVYKSSLRSWKKIVSSYVLENTDFLINMIPEIEFLVKCTAVMRSLYERGCELCRPELAPASEREFRASRLYNPAVALKVSDDIVTNDFAFDGNGRIFVLTGPNRGGKSVITCAVGIAQAMAQLGMLVPAKEARISPADGIYTHFPTGSEDTIDRGRLGEECARLNAIFNKISGDSLVLLDESLSSTGAYEAAYIAAEVLAGLSCAGCRCIFSTHLHELAAEIDGINARTSERGGVKIDSLVAKIEDGQRSFKIIRTKPDGKSYARDIADKYGLSLDKILGMMGDAGSKQDF